MDAKSPAESFEAFMERVEPRVRRALVAAFGPETGREAAAEAFAYAWERWSRVSKMQNPAGYVYRTGVSRATDATRKRRKPLFPPEEQHSDVWFEPGLSTALEGLSERQRSAILLIHGYGWTYEEVAQLVGVTRATVQTHVDRGMRKLRHELGVGVDR